MTNAATPDFALVLLILRRSLGWSQARLGAEAGFAANQINDYERGRRNLTRRRLEHLAGVLGLPVERIDDTLAFLDEIRALAAAAEGSNAIQRQIEAIAKQAGRMKETHTRESLRFLTSAGEALVARQKAEQAMARLVKHTPAERRTLVERSPGFRGWALAEAAALKSVRLAPNHPKKAREWAELGVLIADRLPPGEPWSWRVQGWTRHFLANALRACQELPAAEKVLAQGRKLWEEGAPGDRGYLAEAWVPALEANLRKAQRRLPEALARIEEALALDKGELRAQILLSKSNIFRRTGDSEKSTAVLLEAEPLIDARRDPRLAFGMRFNLLVDLCDLGRAAEAAQRLPGVRLIAERLREKLDLTRCLWLQGKIDAGLGRWDEALGAFRQVQRDFLEDQLPYSYALVSLDLSLVLLEQGRAA